MRKFIAVIIAVLVTIGICAAPANAAKPIHWHYVDTVAGYTLASDPQFDIVGQAGWTLPSYRGRSGEFRMYKAVANTVSEARSLKNFVVDGAKPKSPMAWCRTGYGRGYFLDLAFFYVDDIHKKNHAERTRWGSYLRGYARRHPGCKVYY